MNLIIQDKLELCDYVARPIWVVFINSETKYINPHQVYIGLNRSPKNKTDHMVSFYWHPTTAATGGIISVSDGTTVCLAESPTEVLRLSPVVEFLSIARKVFKQTVEYRNKHDLDLNLFVDVETTTEKDDSEDYDSDIIYD